MNSLGVAIQGKPFAHLIYNFVLSYSNWETDTICFSESFESLSEGLQNALWELGGVPKVHRTDRLSTAVQKPDHPEEFTQSYTALLKHYGLQGATTQRSSPHEIGDVEQRHYRFKKALDQVLMLRGSRNSTSREEYAGFVEKLFAQLNAGRKGRLAEEHKVVRCLPERRLESCKRLRLRVGPSSTIRVNHNVYSVHSQLIGETVEILLYAEHLEVWYAQRCLETIPRLRGETENRIKELKLDIKTDRISCHRFLPNQVRLYLHTGAYCLLWLLRENLKGTALTIAQAGTLRHKLLKIGARIRETSPRVWILFSSGYPYKPLFYRALDNIKAPPT